MMADNGSPALDAFQFTKQTRCNGGFHHIGGLISSICEHFKISINPFEAFGVLQIILTEICIKVLPEKRQKGGKWV